MTCFGYYKGLLLQALVSPVMQLNNVTGSWWLVLLPAAVKDSLQGLSTASLVVSVMLDGSLETCWAMHWIHVCKPPPAHWHPGTWHFAHTLHHGHQEHLVPWHYERGKERKHGARKRLLFSCPIHLSLLPSFLPIPSSSSQLGRISPPFWVRRPLVRPTCVGFLKPCLVFRFAPLRGEMWTVAAWDDESWQLQLTNNFNFLLSSCSYFHKYSYEWSAYLIPVMVKMAKENIPVCLYWNWYGLWLSWLLCFLALFFFSSILNSWEKGNKTLKGRFLSLLYQCKGRITSLIYSGFALSHFQTQPLCF